MICTPNSGQGNKRPCSGFGVFSFYKEADYGDFKRFNSKEA